MTSVLQQLDEASLRRLLGAARSGLLAAPFSSLALAQLVPVPLARGDRKSVV